MRVVNTLLAGIMVTAGAAAFAIVTMSTTPAQATLAQTGVCPSDLGHDPAGGEVGSATDCNGLITFGANGSISTSFGPQSTATTSRTQQLLES